VGIEPNISAVSSGVLAVRRSIFGNGFGFSVLIPTPLCLAHSPITVVMSKRFQRGSNSYYFLDREACRPLHYETIFRTKTSESGGNRTRMILFKRQVHYLVCHTPITGLEAGQGIEPCLYGLTDRRNPRHANQPRVPRGGDDPPSAA
jgi:hypothetical protein